MKKGYLSFIGIDVSKKTFDICIKKLPDVNERKFKFFKNNLVGFDAFLKFLKKCGIDLKTTLICMENTGVYHRLLANLLSGKGIDVWVESGFQIKWSMGLQRGKSDKKDSEKIMLYAERNQDQVKCFTEKDETIQLIGDLLSARSRIIQCIKVLKVPIKEMRAAGLIEQAATIAECTQHSVEALKSEQKKIDKEIINTIELDTELSIKYRNATSVKSIGFVAASYLLFYTEGFTKFKNWKQVASFSGIAPFEYSSGTSIRGKTKVHHMANKKLKTILHMCAVSSLRTNEEMKRYFIKKVAEGKNKMSVLNAIRNKLLARVCSCVKSEREYTTTLAAKYNGKNGE